MDQRLNELIQSTESLVVLPDKRRIKCLYTMHEMPYNYDVVAHYLSGSKYKKACVEHLLEEHKEYIVDVSDSNKHRNQLFCKITWRYINKNFDHVLRHLKGRRFQRGLIRYKECKQKGEEFVPDSGLYHQADYFRENPSAVTNPDESDAAMEENEDFDPYEAEQDENDANGDDPELHSNIPKKKRRKG